MKGISFNVTLSKEQMEEIAALSAEKVNYTNRSKWNNEDWLKDEIEDLKREATRLNKMIVEREIHIDRWKETARILRNTVDMYKEQYGELKKEKR